MHSLYILYNPAKGPRQGNLVQCFPYKAPYNETNENLSYIKSIIIIIIRSKPKTN